MILGRMATYLDCQGLLIIRPERIAKVFVISDITTVFIQVSLPRSQMFIFHTQYDNRQLELQWQHLISTLASHWERTWARYGVVYCTRAFLILFMSRSCWLVWLFSWSHSPSSSSFTSASSRVSARSTRTCGTRTAWSRSSKIGVLLPQLWLSAVSLSSYVAALVILVVHCIF